MLLGQSRNNLDSKGRIFVPVKWRPDTSDHVVVLIGLNPADVKKEERFLQILRYEKFVEFAKVPSERSFQARKSVPLTSRDAY